MLVFNGFRLEIYMQLDLSYQVFFIQITLEYSNKLAERTKILKAIQPGAQEGAR